MDGRNLIGYQYSAMADQILEAMDPATREKLEGYFNIASEEEIDSAMQKALEAFTIYKSMSGVKKAALLRAIADEIMDLGDKLIRRAMQESGLPEGRITGERGRTVNQLRLFADLVEEGSWVEATIDTAIPDRKPAPKPDIRKMLVPLGPVVVFTASNFPLAFSTAGGDTAAALAAGCPVIVKAHESHLGTNALIANAIKNAARKLDMPEGIFSSLNGTGAELGQALVRHPLTCAVAFTGSLKAGKAIFDAAAKRSVPIPVFAEMGSINPVILMEGALQKRASKLARQFASSINLGAGQFCTNPGVMIAVESQALKVFEVELVKMVAEMEPGIMLNKKICKTYHKHSHEQLSQLGVKILGRSTKHVDKNCGEPMIATVNAHQFISNPKLREEVFGPFSLLVRCASKADMLEVAKHLDGQLTATILAEPDELSKEKELINTLQQKAGRLILNNVPTGVEVCAAMQHGGPYPATTDSRFTSVGTDAIKRFARPLAFQNWQPGLLPAELRDENVLGIWRRVNGEIGKE